MIRAELKEKKKFSMDDIMRQKIIETPNENPIKYVLLVLGFLSFIATLFVAGFLNEQFFMFKVTTAVGFICGIISLPIGFKLIDIRLNLKQNPDQIIL